MIEPTVGRMDTCSELAVVNGVNLPLAGYSDLAGLPRPTPGVHPTATAWRKDWLINRKAARFKGKGALHGPEGMPIVDGIWRSSDPLPGLTAYPWRLLTGGSRAVLRKLGCWQ